MLLARAGNWLRRGCRAPRRLDSRIAQRSSRNGHAAETEQTAQERAPIATPAKGAC
jgi:hypothetical protein